MNKINELMDRAQELPYGEARTILVEDALRHAEASGDQLLAFRIREELRVVYEQGGEPAKAFAAFSRCLSEYDRDPGKYNEADRYRLLWGFKGTISALTRFPEIPLDRTLAVLDDMERRFREGGLGLQPVYMCRNRVAQHLGDTEAADEWYGRWHAAPRTDLSDCIGCDPGTKVSYLAWRGRDEDALELAAPVLNEEFTCSEQPQTILTTLMPVLLRQGELTRASEAHRRAYRLQRSRRSELWAIAEHLEFCARTGNEAAGLSILERHLGWLDRPPAPHNAMGFAAAAALLLRRLAETGHGDLTVARPGYGDRQASTPTVETLRVELAEYAEGLAARFDARNGTSRQGDWIRGLLTAEPLTDHLPMTPHARRPAAPPVPEPAVPSAADPAELLDLAEEHWTRQEVAAAVAAWTRFDRRAGELGLDLDGLPALAGRRADGQAMERLVAGDLDGALAIWERAAELHTEAGDLDRAHSTRSRRGALLCSRDESDEGFALLAEAIDHLDVSAPGSRRALSAKLRLAMVYDQLDRAPEALVVLNGATAAPGLDAADLALARARTLIQIEDGREEAVEGLRDACATYRALGCHVLLTEAAFMLGQLVNGPEHEAYALFTEVITHAPADMAGVRAAAHNLRGIWLLRHERAAEAVEDLVESVAGFTAEGHQPQAAIIRLDLAAAYLETGRALDAAEAAEEAVLMLGRLGDDQTERRGRYWLACAQRELGEGEESAATFTTLAGDEPDPGVSAQLLESAAEVLTGMDKDDQAADRFTRAAELYDKLGDPYAIARTRRRAGMCHMWSGDSPAGLASIELAQAALTTLPDEPATTWERALVDYDHARVLADLGRIDEAVTRADAAIEGFTRLGEEEPADIVGRFRAEILEE